MSAQGSETSVSPAPANDPVFVPSIEQDEMPDSLSAEAVAAIRATVEPAKNDAPADDDTPPETDESLADDEQPEEEATEEDAAADDATDGDEEGAEAGEGTDAQPDGFDRAADLADFRAMLRGEKPAAEPITPSAGKADAAKPTASAGPTTQADSGTSTASSTIDPDSLVQTFRDEFGDEAANAIAPVFKAVAELQKQNAELSGAKQQAAQAQQVVQIHKFLDTKADAGLADKIGNGAKGTLTKAQIDNRVELVETARLYAQREQARGRTLTDDEAIAKAARFLFDVQIPAGKPSAPSRIDAKVEQRSKSKTLRPRGSVRSQDATAISDDDTYGLPPEAKSALKAVQDQWKKLGL